MNLGYLFQVFDLTIFLDLRGNLLAFLLVVLNNLGLLLEDFEGFGWRTGLSTNGLKFLSFLLGIHGELICPSMRYPRSLLLSRIGRRSIRGFSFVIVKCVDKGICYRDDLGRAFDGVEFTILLLGISPRKVSHFGRLKSDLLFLEGELLYVLAVTEFSRGINAVKSLFALSFGSLHFKS